MSTPFVGRAPERENPDFSRRARTNGAAESAESRSANAENAKRGEADDLIARYGHLIVDECHHIPAVSFERVAKRSPAKYVLGLSATTARKDGHHPIIFMQCGPVRFRWTARQGALSHPFSHRVIIRRTSFRLAQSEGLWERAVSGGGGGREAAPYPDLSVRKRTDK